MNNPDEKTAVEQFGREGKYFGACVLLATMPGLPMFGHGQIEGYHEKYGMEYKRSYWDEKPDGHLVWLHERNIFPLLRRRWLFSGSENFVLYDFFAGDTVNENVFAYSNRSGDQRAVVLSHNSYATTAGWIRESVAFATQDADSGAELTRTSLAESLGLINSETIYYAFRDHTLGLVFLRNGRELVEKGLFAELGEYEFHVFMDFREIRDDAAGSWGRLCRELNGRGVESLEDELKQLHHAELNRAFRTVLELAPATATSTSEKKLQSVIRKFLVLLAAESGTVAVKNDSTLTTLPATLSALAGLLFIKPASRSARSHLETLTTLLGSASGTCLLLTWLLLKGRSVTIKEFGLDYSLKSLLATQDNLQEDSYLREYFIQLIEALLAVDLTESAQPDLLPAKAFVTSAGRNFLLVHESSGVEWFNKERFDDLLIWSSAITLSVLATQQPAARTISGWLAKSALQNSKISELAAHAGYRTALLANLLKPAEVHAGPGKKPGPARQSSEKNINAKSRSRTRSAKTPDNKVSR
jgi:hypothetical protein